MDSVLVLGVLEICCTVLDVNWMEGMEQLSQIDSIQ